MLPSSQERKWLLESCFLEQILHCKLQNSETLDIFLQSFPLLHNLIMLIYLIILQHDALSIKHAGGLPTSFKLLPQYLNDLGYASYMVGKCVAQRLQNCAVLLSQYQSVLSGGTWATAMKSTFHRTGGSTTFMDFTGAAKIIGDALLTWDVMRPIDLKVCMHAVHISKVDCDAGVSPSVLIFYQESSEQYMTFTRTMMLTTVTLTTLSIAHILQ